MLEVIVTQNNQRIDISNIVETCVVSGDISQCARKAEISFLRPQFIDLNIPNVIMGAMVQIYESKIGIFRGYVEKLNVNNKSDIEKMTCYDKGLYLNSNQMSKSWKNTTPEAITKDVCSIFGIQTNILSSTGNKIDKYAANNQNLFKIIMENYQNAATKDGKNYYIYFENDRLNVLKQGERNAGPIFDEFSIDSLTIDKSIEKMVNRVVVYDNKGGIVSIQENKEWQKLYGVRQLAITKEDKKDNNAIAKGKLNGMDHDIKLECPGNVYCRTGYTVDIKFKEFGLNHKMYIKRDQHNWNNGIYTMSLDLTYKLGGGEN